MAQYKVTNKDLFEVVWRHNNAVETVSSYERQQSISFGHGISKLIDKFYADDEDARQDAWKRHTEFYNSNTPWCFVIQGIVLSMEEQKANGSEDITGDSIRSIKLGLMGPLAGVGDSIDQGVMSSLINQITVPMAYEGNLVAGVLGQVLIPVIRYAWGYYLIQLGYKKGKESVIELMNSGLLKKVIDVAGIVGMFAIGALATTTVKLTTTAEIVTTIKTISIQSQLDAILPKLLPMCAILIYYALISKKGTKVILKATLITMALFIVLAYLKLV